MISKDVGMEVSPIPKASDIDERGCPVEHEEREFGPLLMGTQRMANCGWFIPHTNRWAPNYLMGSFMTCSTSS